MSKLTSGTPVPLTENSVFVSQFDPTCQEHTLCLWIQILRRLSLVEILRRWCRTDNMSLWSTFMWIRNCCCSFNCKCCNQKIAEKHCEVFLRGYKRERNSISCLPRRRTYERSKLDKLTQRSWHHDKLHVDELPFRGQLSTMIDKLSKDLSTNSQALMWMLVRVYESLDDSTVPGSKWVNCSIWKVVVFARYQ